MTAEVVQAPEIRSISVDRDAITSHLTALFGGADEGWISVMTISPNGGDTKIIFWFDIAAPNGLDLAGDFIAAQASRVNVFVGVNLQLRKLPRGQRGGTNTVAAVTSFVFDLDIGGENHPATRTDALTFVRSWPLPPSLIVHSGRGLHLYWLFREPYCIEGDEERIEVVDLSRRWGALGERLAAQLGYHFDNVSDLARILRPAGSLHLKDSHAPKPVRILDESGNRYALADFEDVLPADLPADNEAPPAPDEGEAALSESQFANLVRLLRPAWSDGNRHRLAMVVSGWLANNGVAEQSTLELVQSLSTAAHDLDPAEKQKTVGDAYRMLRDGRRPLGWVGLKETLTAKGVPPAQIAELDHVFKPTILINGQPWPGAKARDKDGASDQGGGGAPPDDGEPQEHKQAPPLADAHLTDLGNSDRLIAKHGDNMRYCKIWGKWIVTDGRRWAIDNTLQVERWAQEVVREILIEATNATDLETREKLARHALASQQARRVAGMIELARARVAITPDLLDQDVWLLNCQNGTIDLRTGRLRPHDRADYITKIAPIDFDPNAKAKRWETFMLQISADDAEQAAFTKRLLGYSLSGDQSERVLPICHGGGRNGKSVLMETVAATLGGDYASTLAAESLMQRRGGDDDRLMQRRAALKGARFVAASETGEGARLNEALIKSLTGNERITGRYLYGEQFDFSPTHTLWLATNHRPVIRDTTNSTWDRLRLIPFLRRFVTDEDATGEPGEIWANTKLGEELVKEKTGIFAWLVAGCLEWQQIGLRPPKRLKEATQAYRTDEDLLGRFIDECCHVARQALIPAGQLYSAYVKWCEENGERPITQTAFGRALTERGFERKRHRNGIEWRGIGLRIQRENCEDVYGREWCEPPFDKPSHEDEHADVHRETVHNHSRPYTQAEEQAF